MPVPTGSRAFGEAALFALAGVVGAIQVVAVLWALAACPPLRCYAGMAAWMAPFLFGIIGAPALLVTAAMSEDVVRARFTTPVGRRIGLVLMWTFCGLFALPSLWGWWILVLVGDYLGKAFS